MTTDASWITTEALIYSAEWFEAQSKTPSHWSVTYSYRINGEYYSGEFVDWSSEKRVNYRKGETLLIEYQFNKPSRSRVPRISSWWSRVWLPFLIGSILGALVMVFRIFSQN